MSIRRATIADIKKSHRLISDFAKKQDMLPRSLNEMYENVRDLLIYEENGEIVGICALHVLWEDLAEIRSLAVASEWQGRGIGKKLIKKSVHDAVKLGVKKVFALTYQPEFFMSLGFREVDKSELPQKIWGDCVRCPKFPDCDEHAVIIDLNGQ